MQDTTLLFFCTNRRCCRFGVIRGDRIDVNEEHAMKLPACLGALFALVFAVGSPARADLIGTTVTGTLEFNVIPTNFFDPANNGVPGTGYLNSADAFDSATVVIAPSPTTYGFSDPANLDTANFSATQLTVTDTVYPNYGAVTWTMTFTDSAFTSLTQVSDNFLNGLSSSLTGDLITLTWGGSPISSDGVTYTAVFDVDGPAPSPEPNTLVVVGVAILAGLAFAWWHRRHSFPRSLRQGSGQAAWECSLRRSASS